MDDKTFKSRNILVLLFEALIILIAVGGLTFATSRLINSTRTIVTFGEYNVDYIGKTDIVVSDLEPISDSLINYNTTEGVMRLEFSLRGVETNEEENLIYDIMVSDMNIDCSLLNEYTKWNLYKNGELISEGNFSPKFDGNVLTDNFRLTETQQDLPKYNEDYDNYVLIIWISEVCDDLTNCDIVSQNDILNSRMDMKVFVGILGGKKVNYERVPNNDATCVNKPELYEGMIPVYYSDGDWKIANSTNSDVKNSWYDYSNSKWANSVIVNSSKYVDSKVGTIIEQEDILGYYVWIPRFRYKMWNVMEQITDSYDAYNKGIDIIFESGTHTNGVINCNGDRCDAKNGNYLTHPAFGDTSRGFWVSKYEISVGNKFIPNVEVLRNETLDNYKNMINGLSNMYKFNNVDSHIISNMEWGAISYLSHSKYGLCKDNICESMGINGLYISENNKQDTTTRDVYGVYDMAGSSAEYVLGNTGIGSAMDEVIISENEAWYQGSLIKTNKEYILRGGVDRGMFSTGDIGMFDVSTRAVLVNK